MEQTELPPPPQEVLPGGVKSDVRAVPVPVIAVPAVPWQAGREQRGLRLPLTRRIRQGRAGAGFALFFQSMDVHLQRKAAA